MPAPATAQRMCSVAGCVGTHLARGWCRAHYKRWEKYSDPLASKPRPQRGERRKRCTMPDCDDLVAGLGLCNRHWLRRKRTGDPTMSRSRWDGHRALTPADKERRRRARKAAVAHEHVTRSAVLDRDGWRCGICHDAIDPELAYPHPESASLDHIVPLASGGTHTYRNTQAAHLVCNLRKGTTMKETQCQA